jgi:hypothetical protein
MKKWTGWLIRKEYFKIEVEANTWEEAKDLVGEAEIEDEPVDIDWEVYDVEETN